MTWAVECKNLSFAYHDSKVLDQASLQIEEGKFIAMIGPNGGGKTTLLKLIMGLLSPMQGEITIYGTLPKQARAKLAYVPQNLQFDRKIPLSVLDVVLMGRLSKVTWFQRYRPIDRDIAMQALEDVGLKGFAHKHFGQLSGGQAQRVLIARAFASEPKLLLLDEPTANVDTQTSSEIYHLLLRWRKEKQLTILMVTHQLQALIHSVDQVVCVQRQIAQLLPSEVCQHFALGLYHLPKNPDLL